MRCLNYTAALLCAWSLVWSAPAQAKPKLDSAKTAEKKPSKTAWDVEQPKVESRQQAIDVQTGTWMSLDVSPDGKKIIFDPWCLLNQDLILKQNWTYISL